MSLLRLAVVATHPIQYYAPLFRRLHERAAVDVRVFYEWEGGASAPTLDRAFGTEVQWDIPLLEGYPHEFVPNVAETPGTHTFGGLDNPELVPQLETYRPDAILLYGWAYRSHLRVLRAFRGRVPLLFRGDSTLLDERPGGRRLLRRVWLRWVYRHVDVALYVGQHNREYFLAHGLDDEQLVWAPHSIETSRFSDPTGGLDAEANRWRSRLGIPPDALSFVFAGKLEPKKAPEDLLEAFVRMSRRDAHLVFVGSGPLEGALRERARAEGDRVHFVGFQNQSRMPVAYRLGDVLALPSRGPGETWGLAVNEAFACGRPAVVSDRVGCGPDLVLPGRTGARVAAGEPGALCAVLDSFASDREATARMGLAARVLVEGWSLDVQAGAIERAAARVASPSPLRHR